MGGNGGKHRWKISFHLRSNSAAKPIQQQQQQEQHQPPKEFLCPISGSLMSDPVVVSSGQTFERLSVQICRDLGFSPLLPDKTFPDFTAVIPNLAIRSSIANWCQTSGTMHPRAPDYASVEKIIRTKMRETEIGVSEIELLKAVPEIPPRLFSHAVTELTHRVNHFYSSSSSDDSVVITASASPFTPLPLATRPACYSCSPSSQSSEFETINLTRSENCNANSKSSPSPEENDVVPKLMSPEVHEQERGVISLRELTRTKKEIRVPLCNPRLLSSLCPLITSRYAVVQTNAIASLVNLSLEKQNKVNIVRSGFVPLLIDVLKAGSSEPQEHAAGAIFSLALEDENKMAIGVLGALQPLMHALRSESQRTRHDSALALYHLSLIKSNRLKLVKLGAVATLLSMVKSGESASRVLLVLCNLAACSEGRSAMLDANAVAILVGMLREGGESVDPEATQENCVVALFALSQGSMRFKGLAKEARAPEVLREIEDRGSERARAKAKRLLQMMRGRGEGEEDEDDEEIGGAEWDSVLESGGLRRTRFRVGSVGPNSTNF